MGLDANYPAVTIKNETDSVPIYNDQHLPVGVLSANTSRSVNVTCIAQKSGGDWEDAYYYRQMNPAGNPVPSKVGRRCGGRCPAVASSAFVTGCRFPGSRT